MLGARLLKLLSIFEILVGSSDVFIPSVSSLGLGHFRGILQPMAWQMRLGMSS